MLILYGANGSPFVRKVKVVLAEKNLSCEQEQTTPFPASAEYRKISPLGKIPALRDGELTLADSSVICAYLERTHPAPALYPAAPGDYARALWFEEYGDSGLAPIIGNKMFFNRIIGPRLMKRPFDEAQFRKGETEDLPPMYDYLESNLNGDYLVGSTFTIGDIGIATQFINLRFAGVTPAPDRWPRLTAYLERMYARPSFKASIDLEAKIFAARG